MAGKDVVTQKLSTIIYFERDYNDSALFADQEMPDSFENGLRTVLIVCLTFLPIYTWLIWLIGVRFYRGDFNEKQKQRKFMIFVLGNLISAWVHYIWMIVSSQVGMAWEFCRWYGGTGALLYCTSNYFLYETLHLRATSLQKEYTTDRSKKLLRLSYLGTKSYIAVTLGCPIAFHGIAYFTADICVQSFTIWLLFTILFFDTSLSLAYLYLFWEPVHYLMNSIDVGSATHVNKQIAKMLKKNLVWSSIAILSTFGFMVILTVINLWLFAGGETSEDSYLNLFQWSGSGVDMAINTFSNLSITSKIWVPASSKILNKIFNPEMAQREKYEVTNHSTGHNNNNTNDKFSSAKGSSGNNPSGAVVVPVIASANGDEDGEILAPSVLEKSVETL